MKNEKKPRILSSETKAKISASMMEKHNNPGWPMEYNPVQKVRCIELCCVFDSIHAAAKMINTTASNIEHVLQGRQGTAGGYHWARSL